MKYYVKNIISCLLLALFFQHMAVAQKFTNPGKLAPAFNPTLPSGKKVLIAKVTYKKNFTGATSTTTTNYEYDRNDRLIRVDHVEQIYPTEWIVAQTNFWSEILLYDLANRLSMVITQSTSFATTYSPMLYKFSSFKYDEQSRIVSVHEGVVSGQPNKQYTYTYLGSDVVCTVGPMLQRPLAESDLERKIIFKRTNDLKNNLVRMTDVAQWAGIRDTIESFAQYLTSPNPLSNLPEAYNMVYLYKTRSLENIMYNRSRNLIGYHNSGREFTVDKITVNEVGYPTTVIYIGSSIKREYNFEYIIK